MIPGLRMFRKLFNYTQEDVAVRVGVSQKQVYLWENAGVKPHPETMGLLCQIFECEFDELLIGPRKEHPKLQQARRQKALRKSKKPRTQQIPSQK